MAAKDISIVVAGRNDNYGGAFLKNLRQFVENVGRFLPGAELIIVEWNPPADRPLLHDVLPKWPTIITVYGGDGTTFKEYLAKNAGIDKATRPFVLATNPDCLFSIKLADRIRSEGLRSDCYYRVNRTDIEPVPEVLGHWSIEDWAKTHRIVKHTKYGQQPLKLARFARRAWRYRTLNLPHENGAGDFILASKKTWEILGRFPALSMRSHIDSIFTCTLHKHRNLVVFQEPFYHQDHERPPFVKDTEVDQIKAEIMRG